MRASFLAAPTLLLTLNAPAQAQPVHPPSVQQNAATVSAPATTERQKKLNDQAQRLSALGRQIHESVGNMKGGEISATAIKQIRELEKLANTMKDEAPK
ncbi:hypothetical protein Terro_2364 [Terriglobus roseus DSM 18391]|uniref:Uncharacterized protein n=1 Tax=Terriglobus roseus (strain DSM 18391 / NRRL B-41598 / KBS 63) TaxID=926566 RepID=I3ZGB6_TERRK|nr:hypothetical protein [Terriglobus roseus]AFL88284.1 hypothetical protein Terro_1998 [Terriglobus roseus DSM 18391]AFL88625.1 hypothetical protein Terro_2364 [Terriglobus roseus DSM 18391]